MTTEEKNKEALRKIKTIHPDIRRAVASSANADKIFDIGKKYDLLVDKIGELASETMYLMLGVTHPNDFVGNLAERLRVDRATAGKIADDINREIFSPVREHLRALFDTSHGEILAERPPNGGLTAKISPIDTTALSGISRQPTAPANNTLKPTTLEDLEAELERALAEEKGVQPLSMVKKPAPAPKPISQPQPTYKGADPYREQVEEDLPNVRGKEYVPQNMEQVSSFKFQASRVQPTPTPKPVEENSVFSPQSHANQQGISEERLPKTGRLTSEIPSQLQAHRPTKLGEAHPEGAAKTDPYREPAKQNSTLSPFRGFKMNGGAEKKEKDPYKEPLM